MSPVPSRRTGAGGVLAALLLSPVLLAQDPPADGPRQVDPGWHALVHATAVTQPGQTVQDATIVLRNGLIVSVTSGGQAPQGARVWDCTGLTVYAGLIESHVAIDVPAPPADAPGTHWNAKITPQRHALEGAGVTEDIRKELRELGFTAAANVPGGGIFRGTAAVVLLADPKTGERPSVVLENAFLSVDFARGGGFGGRRGYPGAEMGMIAITRQTFMDREWHRKRKAVYAANPAGYSPVAPSDALDALIELEDLPLQFNASDELQILRFAKIADEFGLTVQILGSGMEFRRLDAVVETGLPIIVPVQFPDAPDLDTIEQLQGIDLRTLMTWEQAPTNLARLVRAGARVALTTNRLEDRSDFHANLRKAMSHGVSEDQALAMLTTEPAALLGVSDKLGRIANGMIGNLVVVDGELFDADGEIRSVFVEGRFYEISTAVEVDPSGDWSVTSTREGSNPGTMEIRGKKITFKTGEVTVRATNVTLKAHQLDFQLDATDLGTPGMMTVHAEIEGDNIYGTGVDPQGVFFTWSGQRTGAAATDEDEEEATPEAALDISQPLPLPLGAYGLTETPAQEDVVFTGATIWTSAEAGIIEDAALHVRGGRIIYVGPRAGLPDTGSARVVDVTGKQITPGIIDAHSHTAISGGINEGSQAVTSEVRIQDVVNPDDINIYRQLAGGVTAINQLHGSANPIGGQNHVAKMRWGARTPYEMTLQGAPPGIKFALGENPRGTNRYPSTRMGVAAIIRDRFVAAGEYMMEWELYNGLSAAEKARAMPPHKDLELEAIAEILRGERLIHSHSYRQDEIFMLCELAAEFGFKLGTLQHVLEGFKVAEAILANARGASTFSDWWSYKLEVYDAIGENGAIMYEVGVPVSFNSDSSELARRLNTEAGKAVKYGDVPPSEALKFVTYNPAYQLNVEDMVGSLEAGKDADFAIWSGDPLSYYSICEATYVDGRAYFTLARDRELRAVAQADRQRLIQKVLAGDDDDSDDDDEGRGRRGGRPRSNENTDMERQLQGTGGVR